MGCDTTAKYMILLSNTCTCKFNELHALQQIGIKVFIFHTWKCYTLCCMDSSGAVTLDLCTFSKVKYMCTENAHASIGMLISCV